MTEGEAAPGQGLLAEQAYQFALQPIVEPMRRTVTSFEFLIRSGTGGSPEQLFSTVPPIQRYRMDLESKHPRSDWRVACAWKTSSCR